jgi:hypothetical protein
MDGADNGENEIFEGMDAELFVRQNCLIAVECVDADSQIVNARSICVAHPGRDVGTLLELIFDARGGASSGRARDVLLDFFESTLTNDNTRRAYLAAVTRFASWCRRVGIPDLRAAKPHHLGTYLALLEREGFAITTRKQQLAALRMF